MSTTSGRPATGTGRPSGAPRPRPAPSGAPRPNSAPSGARPAGRVSPTAAPGDTEPRKVRLTVSRIEPFSVMKISFMISVALGIAGVVVVAVLWLMLSSLGLFSTINGTLNELQSSSPAESRVSVLDLLSFPRVLSLTVVFGVVNVILLTAVATLTAIIYNICSALVGGMHTTLTDD